MAWLSTFDDTLKRLADAVHTHSGADASSTVPGKHPGLRWTQLPMIFCVPLIELLRQTTRR